jgi:type IV pilus assembly protein PilV
MAARSAHNSRQRGFTMMEVLVSMVIAVFGLLGLVGIQAFAHQAELESYQRAQALVLMNDMVERVNANRRSASCYSFTTGGGGTPFFGTGYTGTPVCVGTALNTQTRNLAESDMKEWDLALKGAAEKSAGASVGAMVGARGCVSFDAATQVYTVIVAWQGMTETFSPVVNCANGLYGSEPRRRAVWTTFRIANLS